MLIRNFFINKILLKLLKPNGDPCDPNLSLGDYYQDWLGV